MSKTQKKISKGLRGFFIAGGVLTLLYIAFFFILAFLTGGAGDAEFDGVGTVLSFHVQGIGKLLSFTYGDGSILYFSLGVLLIAFPICWVIFLVAAGIIASGKKRSLMWWAVAIVFLDLIAYAVFASGSLKYFDIINGKGPFAGNQALLAMTLCLLFTGLAHFVVSMVSYFWSIVETYKNPGASDSPESPEEVKEEAAEESLPEEQHGATLPCEVETQKALPAEMVQPIKVKRYKKVTIIQNFVMGHSSSRDN